MERLPLGFSKGGKNTSKPELEGRVFALFEKPCKDTDESRTAQSLDKACVYGVPGPCVRPEAGWVLPVLNQRGRPPPLRASLAEPRGGTHQESHKLLVDATT